MTCRNVSVSTRNNVCKAIASLGWGKEIGSWLLNLRVSEMLLRMDIGLG